MSSDNLRVPPVLGGGKLPRPGSLVVTSHYNPKTVLDTYSPYPVFNKSSASRDPFGLDAFLLAPFDDVWQYMNPAVMPTEQLHLDDMPQNPSPQSLATEPQESRRLSNLRRRSPLASQPPVSAETGGKPEKFVEPKDEAAVPPVDEETTDVADPSGEAAHSRKSLTSASRLRTLMGRKMSSTHTSHPDGIEESRSSRLSDCRTDSVCSALSSVSSSSDGSWEGIETPADNATLPTDVSPAIIAAALDDSGKKPGWRDWINNRRSLLGIKPELLESPGTGELDPATEALDTPIHSRVADTDAARTAAQLRRMSISKLAALRMPSPHPLALILTRQHVNLPDEVAYSIPASKRVYPMSVNVVQRTGSDLAPTQGGGLRLALAVRGIITKIDKGDRPYGATPLRPRQSQRQSNIPRPRGVRDFIDRPPFEERMVAYYPGDVCTHVSMARSGFAIYDLEFSDYITAVARTEESPPAWSASPKPRVASTGSLPPPPRLASPATDKRASRLLESRRQTLFQPKESERPATPPATSFRTARPKPATWDDSSDEDEPVTDKEENTKPLRPATLSARNNKARGGRESRLVDPVVAMEILSRARERRAEFNTGECERRAESNNRNSMMLLSKQAMQSTPALESQATQARRLQHRSSTMSLAKSVKSTKQQRPPSSLPASPRSGPQQDRRRVVSQYDPMSAAQHRTSVMGMGLGSGMGVYGIPGVPAVPPVPVYNHPMMCQPMMYAPVAMNPMMGYNPQFAQGVPVMPQMYRPAPQQIPAPGMLPSRRRERPVS